MYVFNMIISKYTHKYITTHDRSVMGMSQQKVGCYCIKSRNPLTSSYEVEACSLIFKLIVCCLPASSKCEGYYWQGCSLGKWILKRA